MIEELIPDNIGDIIKNGLENYISIFENTKPKIIYRKIIFKGRFYKKYLIVYNPIHDFLPSPRIVDMMTRLLLKKTSN